MSHPLERAYDGIIIGAGQHGMVLVSKRNIIAQHVYTGRDLRMKPWWQPWDARAALEAAGAAA